LPAATVRDTPSFVASASASVFIDTKYGFVRVLRTKVTPTFLVEPLLLPPDDFDELHAAVARASAPTLATANQLAHSPAADRPCCGIRM